MKHHNGEINELSFPRLSHVQCTQQHSAISTFGLVALISQPFVAGKAADELGHTKRKALEVCQEFMTVSLCSSPTRGFPWCSV